MKRTIRKSLLAALICAVGLLAVAPALAAAQSGAAEEYDLELPGSGGSSDTPEATSPTSGSGDDFPVAVVVVVAGAAIAAGFAGWRLRAAREPDGEPDASS